MIFKRRSYQSEMAWYFDTENHTKLDKFEIFVRYKLLEVMRPKTMWRLIKRKYYELYLKHRCETVYTASLERGIDSHVVKKGTNIGVQLLFNGLETYRVRTTTYKTLEEASQTIQKLINEYVGGVVNGEVS